MAVVASLEVDSLVVDVEASLEWVKVEAQEPEVPVTEVLKAVASVH